MTNLDSILKSRDMTLPAQVCLVKAMDFPGVTWGKDRTVKSLSCVWLCDLMDHHLPGSSVRGIFQARVLEWLPFLLQGMFLTQGLNLGLPHCKQMLYRLSHQGGQWMWELDHKEGWAPKKDAFALWCLRRLLRVPWTARRSNQSILREISPEYSLEGLMLKLKLSYFGHLMWRADSLEKTLMLG